MSRTTRWIAFSLVFGLLPLALLEFGLERSWQRQEAGAAAQAGRRAQKALERLLQLTGDQAFFRALLQRTARRLAAAHTPVQAARHLDDQRRRHPGLFDFYVTDAAGNLLPRLSSPVPSRFVIKRLVEELSNWGEVTLPPGQRKALETFLGEAARVERVKNDARAGRLSEVGIGGRRTWFFARRAGPYWFLAHLHRGAVGPDFPVRTALAALNRRQGEGVFGTHRVGEPARTPGCSPAEGRLVERALARFETSTREVFLGEGTVVAVLMAGPADRLWLLLRRAADRLPTRWVARGRVATGVLFLLFAVTAFPFMVPARPRWLSIRLKMVGLVGIALFLPLVALVITGLDHLAAIGESLERQALADLENSVRGFDRKFPLLERSYVRLLRPLLAGALRAGDLDMTRLEADLERLRVRLPLRRPTVIRHDGALLSIRDRDKILYQLGLRVLERYNASRGFADEAGLAGKLKLDALFASDEDLNKTIQGLTQRVGQFTHLHMGNTNRFLYLEMLHDSRGAATHLFFFNWQPKELVREYCRRTILAHQRDLNRTRLFAVREEGGAWDVPPGASRLPWMRGFIERLHLRNSMITDRIFWNGEWFLAVGLPSSVLDEYAFVQVQSREEIVRTVARVRGNLVVLAALSLFLALVAGSALGQQFLAPIRALMRGVAAIEAREFKHRVALTQPDELGQLSAAFDGMLEGLDELSVARTIQENLLPAAPLQAGPWRVTGRSQAATELGGDYFDFFELPDGRLVVLLGDVAGHGAPASLLMAMAKAAVALETGRDPSPARVMEALNGLLHRHARRRLTTFFFSLIDPRDGTIRYLNAGHCPPLLVQASGERRELGHGALPLGARRTLAHTEEQAVIGPGDRLFLFTDGLAEFHDGAGQPFGYQRLHDLLAARPWDDPAPVLAALAAHRASLAQEDDMTLLIVVRETEGPARG
ncbi:MAG: SpoIIE family protein phosphatase [Candidatus Riflebacteria bacterium]|nr:SpoIIE family protein phosphatase [Candidatus Riflebacteria bacterium]